MVLGWSLGCWAVWLRLAGLRPPRLRGSRATATPLLAASRGTPLFAVPGGFSFKRFPCSRASDAPTQTPCPSPTASGMPQPHSAGRSTRRPFTHYAVRSRRPRGRCHAEHRLAANPRCRVRRACGVVVRVGVVNGGTATVLPPCALPVTARTRSPVVLGIGSIGCGKATGGLQLPEQKSGSVAAVRARDPNGLMEHRR